MDRYGYINTNGDFVVDPIFLKATAFFGDYARADLAFRDAAHPELAGCSVDRSGRVTPIKNLSTFSTFSDGLCHFGETSSWGKKGFVDARGKVVVDCIYQAANNFSQGRAIVCTKKPGAEGKKTWDYEYILIDRRGRELRRIGVTGTIPHDWHDGLAVCRPEWQEDNRYCYVDRRGIILVRAPEDHGSDFSEGLAAFRHRLDRSLSSYGYFDKTGKVVIPPQYEFAGDFHEGLAAVQLDGRWHYINKNGEIVITLPVHCSRAKHFSQGLAAVQLGGTEQMTEWESYEVRGGKFGFIDHSGKVVIAPRFGESWTGADFTDDGLSCVSEEIDGRRLYGFIDCTGSYVIQPSFMTATHFCSGLAAVQVESPGFHPEDWHDWQNTEDYPSRAQALAEFFKAYPVFGMQRAEVYAVLGQGTVMQYSNVNGRVESYAITSWFCGNGCSSFELVYEDDLVAGWRNTTINDKPPFIRKPKNDAHDDLSSSAI